MVTMGWMNGEYGMSEVQWRNNWQKQTLNVFLLWNSLNIQKDTENKTPQPALLF